MESGPYGPCRCCCRNVTNDEEIERGGEAAVTAPHPLTTSGTEPRIGVCRGCGHPLYAASDRDVEPPSSPDLRWAQSRARAIGRMLAVAQCETPTRDGFARLLAFSLDAAGARGLTRRQLALALGVAPPLFYAWSVAQSFPPLAACADVCLQLGADPGEVILPEFDPRGRTWPPPGDPILAGVDDVWAFALRGRGCANEREHPR